MHPRRCRHERELIPLYALARLAHHGVASPRPDDLIRGGIIGTVEVTGIVTASDSEWFGGEAGLTLANPKPVDPIAAAGALGYFECIRAKAFALVRPWITRFDRAGGDDLTLSLFPDEEPSYKRPLQKPWRER